MSNTRHKQKVSVKWKRNVRPLPVEVIKDENGKTIMARQVDHCINGNVYHPRKGWRKVRPYRPQYLMTSLLLQYGVAPLETN